MTLSINQGIGLLPYTLPEALGMVLYILVSLFGPAVAALVVTGTTEGQVGMQRLLQSIIEWRVGRSDDEEIRGQAQR